MFHSLPDKVCEGRRFAKSAVAVVRAGFSFRQSTPQ